MTKVICFSGGIDSLIAWHYEGKPKAIYFNLHNKYSKKEIKSIKNLNKIIPDLKWEIVDVVDLSKFEHGRTAFIPHRNLILASLANNYGNEIIIAGIKGDNIYDKTPKAFKEISRCLNKIRDPTTPEITIYSPFWKMTKEEIVKWFLLNVRNSLLLLKTSVSCYDSKTKGQCGNCPSCFRKWIALKYNNVWCDDWFEQDVKTFDQLWDYVRKFRNGEYDKQRTKVSLEVLRNEELIK